jgi:hypothetical protein
LCDGRLKISHHMLMSRKVARTAAEREGEREREEFGSSLRRKKS